MANYLFTLTITPVQSFISQARKTKDLFSGSEILSNLMRETIAKFDNHGERVFPQNINFVSNKFVGKLENCTKKDIEKIGKELEEFINNEFYLVGSKILLSSMVKYSFPVKTTLIEEHFKPQMCEFFNVFWVAIEVEKNNYQNKYKELEQSLGAVKNLRRFKQLEQNSSRKCSLCGERNGLFYKYQEDEKGKPKKPAYILKDAIYIKESPQIDESESLCAVCFTKRFKENNSNPSTAKICLLNWLKDVNYNKLKKLNDFDEQWFLKNDRDEIKEFIKENKLDISKQKKYYALIQFDVDNMGKKLSSLDENGQIALSKALSTFANKVGSEVLTSQKGETIYAGGDDFLGFANLTYLFDILEDIQKAFDDEVKSSFPDLTFSTSIIISHYKTPLHKVLDFSRSLLENTKNHFEDKNGIGVIVLSDSAINAQTICRYQDFNLLKELKENKVALGLHSKLHTIFSFIDSQQNVNKEDYDSLIVMIEYEIKRLLKREEGEFNQKLYEKIISFLHKQAEGLKTDNNIFINLDNFIGFFKTLEQLRKVS